MKTISGYKYNTEQECEAACAQLNEHYGIPAHEDSQTTEYMKPYRNYDEKGNVTFLYFPAADELKAVLGDPSNFDINQ